MKLGIATDQTLPFGPRGVFHFDTPMQREKREGAQM
jgi:hypothetical protein